MIEEKLKQLGLVLPPPATPVGAYLAFRRSGKYLFLSGQLPRDANGLRYVGKVGGDLTLEQGMEAARLCALNAVSLVREAVGLDHVQQFIRVVGYVQSAEGFTDQHKVLNGASELFVELFGEAGRHARSAVGVSGLPLNSAVELEVTVEVK